MFWRGEREQVQEKLDFTKWEGSYPQDAQWGCWGLGKEGIYGHRRDCNKL